MMRFTALCVCGTLLVFSSLLWTTVDSNEGDLQRDNNFGPCTVSLRPEGLCRQGQDDGTCPYLISLPPLTVHLPKQLRELEKIVKDLQRLKDDVDQLRKMCADCTVSQTERECGQQREREHEKMKVGIDRHEDEMIWLNERNPDKQKDFIQEYGTNRFTVENTMQGFDDTDNEERDILDEKGGKKWESDRDIDEKLVKEDENEESLKQVTQTYGKAQADGSKGKDKLRQPTIPSAYGNERIADTVIKNVEQNNRTRETVRNKEKDGKENSQGDRENILRNDKGRKTTSIVQNKEKTEESDHHIRKDETKKTGEKTQTNDDRGSDGIKMSEDHDEHTNKERQQHGEERKMETEKGIKVERNNEKPKQTESTGRREKEKTIKEGEGEVEEDMEIKKEIKKDGEKTVQSLQRDYDGGFRKATEITDFVPISPTPHSSKSLSLKDDSNEAITFESPLRSPLSSSNSLLIAGVSQGMTITADGLPTTNTGLGAAGISEHPSPAEEADFRTTSRPTTAVIMSTVGGPGQQITSDTTTFTSTTSVGPGTGLQKQVGGPTVATTTTTAPQNLYKTTFPEVADQSRWTAKKNISSNTVTGVNPLPGREPMPSGKQKSVIKLKANRKHKTLKNDDKPDQVPLPNKKPKHDPRQKPSNQKPKKTLKSKPGQDLTQAQIPKPRLRPLPTDGNLTNTQIPKQEHTNDESQLPIQKPKPHQKSTLPVQRPTPHQKPQIVNATGSDKDPLTDQEPESVEITIINQNLKPDEELVHPLKTDKPDQKQKPHKKPTSEEKTKPAQRSISNQYSPPVQEPKPKKIGTASLTPKINQKPVKELMEDSDENTSPEPKSAQDSSPGQNLTSDHALIKPDEQNQKHPDLTTLQKPESVANPKPDQTPQINKWFKAPKPDQMPLNPKSVNDDIRETESNKTPRALSRHRPPTRPTVEPGTTSTQRPKPSVQIKPSPKTKTDLDPPHITRTTPDDIQNSQTDITPASGHLQQINGMTHSPAETDFSPNKMKTITRGPKTSYNRETGPLPHHHTLPEGFTMSPNSRIISDLRPQTASQPPLIPMSTRPNKIMLGILPSVIPSIRPGSKKPKQDSYAHPRLQVKILDNVEETVPKQTPDLDKIMIPVHAPSAQTTSTTSPDIRPKNPANSGLQPLAPDTSTPSARELRVKINQVAAVFNNSPNGRLPESRPIEHPAGSRPERTDSKLPTLPPEEVTVAMRDCSDYLLRGETKSGVYLVTPDLRSRSFSVLCDMDLDGGGWTLLQRRQDGSVSFNRTWTEYRSGFGKLDGGEFWLGNNMIHLLTRDSDMMLRVELEDFDGVMGYAHYELFRVAGERLHYRLTVGGYSGTAGDALSFSKRYDHNNRPFTTPDRDHDRYPSGNCGAYYSSGWWFDACMASNLNGRYYMGKYKGVRDGIFWGTWYNINTEYYPTNDRQSFKSIRMMIRPKGFTP